MFIAQAPFQKLMLHEERPDAPHGARQLFDSEAIDIPRLTARTHHSLNS